MSKRAEGRALFLFFELLLDEFNEHIDGCVVVSTLWDYDICVAFAGLNKLLVHWFEDTLVTFHHRFNRTSTKH